MNRDLWELLDLHEQDLRSLRKRVERLEREAAVSYYDRWKEAEAREQASMERFLNQAATIDEFGGRLLRIQARHQPAPDGAGVFGPVCHHCRLEWPCPDYEDANWS